jgi:cellulose synthase/poly-beta-1,6-N-acetylglucosamine synthase-like glycosyltransferase
MRNNDFREIRITRLSIANTVFLTAIVTGYLGRETVTAYMQHHLRLAIQGVILEVSVWFLTYGNVLYQWCRLNFYRRQYAHVPASRGELERVYAEDEAPSLAVLIPSYKEEPHVVGETVLSAALAEYPKKSVVLLIDDPSPPDNQEEAHKLDATREMLESLHSRFGVAAAYFSVELAAFRERDELDLAEETGRLARLYGDASRWVKRLAGGGPVRSPLPTAHATEFLNAEIVDRIASEHLATADMLQQRLLRGDLPDRADLRHHYRRLAALFRVQFSYFERKKYVNLSHEANKAMNLNSYIGLMGKSWRQVASSSGLLLTEADPSRADLVVPPADYIITLDADSVLLPDYALRMIHMMQQPEYRDVAIIQTPYSAFPGAPSRLEQIAGATTDLQYIVHQGFTHCGAAFWVGANALIRRRALDDIKEIRLEGAHAVSIYIQDRTLIEDTESSIDLVRAGWKVFNYPARLAYSATPPDFGSLLIQRRRWANGGLLILPKLLSYAAAAPKTLARCKEFIMRLHYLVSLAGSGAAMLLIFFCPFDDRLSTIWLPLSALPYFVLYARDLRIAGYRYLDTLRVYALNLALIPVTAGGVLKSLQQAATGVKLPFGRTPKVSSRSAAPALYCALEIALPAVFTVTAVWDLEQHRWMHAGFSLLNAGFFGYALVALLGLAETVSDLTAAISDRFTWFRSGRAEMQAPRLQRP